MSPVKPKTRNYSSPRRTLREVVALMDRAEERAGREDVGEQALMRGLDTAFPFVRLGLSLSIVGRRSMIGHIKFFGNSPCRSPALTAARLRYPSVDRPSWIL
jgi:hypothetical protein